MSEIKQSVEVSVHAFQTLPPDKHTESDRNEVISSEPKIYKTEEGVTIEGNSSRSTKKKSTILSAGLLMTNACLEQLFLPLP